MTITDEMIEAAARATKEARERFLEACQFKVGFNPIYAVVDNTRKARWPFDREVVVYCDSKEQIKTEIDQRVNIAALTAVYPLIARQVRAETVEECAKALNARMINARDEADKIYKAGGSITDVHRWHDIAGMTAKNEAAIRALTNEASHEG